MALIKCNECNNMVSDKAALCPHCGCPAKFFVNINNEGYTLFCEITGQKYDLSGVYNLVKQGNTPSNRWSGCCKIKEITGLEVADAKGLWDKMVSLDAVPAKFETLKEERARERKNSTTPKCPTCGSTDLFKKSAASRALDGFVFGRLSVEGRSQFECRNCGYKW